MLFKKQAMVKKVEMKEMQKDHTPYAAVKIVSLDGDGSNFDLSIRDKTIYELLQPFQIIEALFDLSNSQYGMRLGMKQLINAGDSIIQPK